MKMNKNNKLIIIVLVIGIIILISLVFSMLYWVNQQQTRFTTNSEEKITWEEYQLSFDYIVDNFSVEGLSVKASTKGDNITAVDVYDALNNRPFLTLNGKYETNNFTPTEEQIVIEDQNQNIQITIAYIYTDNYVGYDILTYPSNAGFGTLNEELVQKSTFIIGSYNNLIFSVNQCAIDKLDASLMDQTIKEYVDLLKEYFDN